MTDGNCVPCPPIVAYRRRRIIQRLGLSAALIVGLASCEQSKSSESTAPLPGRPATMTVVMREFSYQLTGEVPQGRIVFHLTNAGKVDHELILVAQPENYPPIQEQINGNEVRLLAPLYWEQPLKPGTKDAFAVDLAPGRYAMICYISDEGDRLHAEKGMTAEFVVPGPKPKPEEPVKSPGS